MNTIKAPAPSESTAPTEIMDVYTLMKRIGAEFESLSPGLKRIARYIENNFDHLGLDKIQDVARECQIQPSAVVRFSKHFGFHGYIEMQRIFRNGMSAHISHQRNYQARIRDLINESDKNLSSNAIAQSYIEGSLNSMQALKEQFAQSQDLDEAVQYLKVGANLWVIGTNRAFPVASYLTYLLQHTDKSVRLVHGMGSMQSGEMRALRKGDVMVAISFSPYGKETLQAVELAKSKGVKIIAISDTRLSPLCQNATVSLVVTESSVFGFRALTNTMVMVQSLFVALAYQLEIQYSPKTLSP